MLVAVSNNHSGFLFSNAKLADYTMNDTIEPASSPHFILEKLSSLYDGGNPHNVMVSGDLAFVADGYEGLEIINISNPSNPVELGQYGSGGNYYDVWVEGDLAFIAAYADGLVIVNISNPNTPSFVGNYDDGGFAKGVYISNNLDPLLSCL